MEKGPQYQHTPRPSLEFMRTIMKQPDSLLARRYTFDYGIPHEARITEHTPIHTETFFEGITSSPRFAERINPLAEKYLTVHHEPTTAYTPMTTSDILITKARKITTKGDPLYIRILLVKKNEKVTQLEMYSNKPDLEDVLTTTKKVTIVEPKLVTYALEGTDKVYDAAYKEEEVAVRIIDPILESVFQYGEIMDTEKITQGIIDATVSIGDIFTSPIPTDLFVAPHDIPLDTASLDRYLHHEYRFDLEQTWNGFEFSSEKKFDQVDLGEGVLADIFCYRVLNRQTGKVTRLVTTQSIYEALNEGKEIKNARIRPDTKCACHINPDVKCGCDVEFRSSLRQSIQEDPQNMTMIALDTNGVGLNNGLLALHEQYAFRAQDPTLPQEKRQEMMDSAITDHREFKDQVDILLIVAMKLKISNLGIIATNGRKLETFITQVKNGTLETLELPDEMISIFPDTEYYNRVQASLPEDGSRMGIVDKKYKPTTRRTPKEITIQDRRGAIAQFGGIYIPSKIAPSSQG